MTPSATAPATLAREIAERIKYAPSIRDDDDADVQRIVSEIEPYITLALDLREALRKEHTRYTSCWRGKECEIHALLARADEILNAK